MSSAALDAQRHQSDAVRGMRQVLEQSPPCRAALAESAFPAYSHSNPLARWLFWSRVKKARQFAARLPKMRRCLDFGCGGGVMLPLLAQYSRRVVGYDIDLRPFRLLEPHFPMPPQVEVTDDWESVENHGWDLIVALDVLEHVEHLDQTLEEMSQMLVPCGKLLVSGPTENGIYRLGRRLAGREFTGHYHVRDIYAIRLAMQKYFHVQCEATLFYPLPLFKLYSATPLR